MMPATAPDLHYAPPPASLRRRRLIGWVAFGVVLLLLALVWFNRSIGEHLRLVSLQRQCLAYDGKPGRVIYDDDPQRVPTLLKDGRYVGWHPAWVRKTTFALYDNPLFREYSRRTPVLSFRRSQPAAFMHRLRSPGGNERLVVVGLNGGVPGEWIIPQDGQPGPTPRLIFSPYVESPATLRRRATAFVNFGGYQPALDLYIAEGDRFRVIEGRADPADASHFTIDYVHNDVPGTIDGWLNDDETVTLAPRAGEVLERDPTYHWWSPAPGGLPGGGTVIGATGTHSTRDTKVHPVRPKRDAARDGAQQK